MSAPQPTRLRRTAAPAPVATRPTSRAREAVRALLGPFWVVPALWCAAAVVVGVFLPQADRSVSNLPLLIGSGPDGARTVLSTIAGAMISVTGLVFSNTFVVLQLASSQFTPRVLRTFLDDRITQHTLGLFAATFVYALTVLRAVHDDGPVPQLAVSLAFVLVLSAVGMFLAFIHHITTSISVDVVVGRVADDCRALLTAGREAADHLPDERPTLADLPHQHVVTAPSSGHLDLIDRDRLCRVAGRFDARCEVLASVGVFVPEGAPLVLVHLATAPDDVETLDRRVASALELVRARTMRQDVTYGLRRLVDVAERALSPGVNDPTTAVQVLDELHDLLRRLAVSPDPYPVTSDDDGVPRVVTRGWTFAELLDLSLDEIAHYGRDDLQVPRRLVDLLDDLSVLLTTSGPGVDPERADLVTAKRSKVIAASPVLG